MEPPSLALLDYEFKCADGCDASTLAARYGLQPDGWQEQVLMTWLARDASDMFVCTSCGLSVPRQNGKNALIEMRELYGLVAIGEQILHTAHRVDTARKAFMRLSGFFSNDRHPELKDMVECIRRTNGQEEITLKNGASISFSSRVNGSKRGQTFDVVVFDEAQELTNDHMEAIMSTMAAAPLGNRQLIYAGTPPTPVSQGTVFREQRANALEGRDKRQCWHEWSVGEMPKKGSTFADIADLVYETNPAMGIRLDEDFTETEFMTLAPDGFARERLGWWNPAYSADKKAAIGAEKWEACRVDEPPHGGTVSFGVKFDVTGSLAAVSACAKYDDGTALVELVDVWSVGHSVKKLAEWLAERKDRTALIEIDGKAKSDALVSNLESLGVNRRAFRAASTPDITAACSMFADAVDGSAIVHISQPELDEAAATCTRRPVGKNGGWAFADGESCSSISLESAALAYHAASTTKRNPNRKMRVG